MHEREIERLYLADGFNPHVVARAIVAGRQILLTVTEARANLLGQNDQRILVGR